MGTNLLEQDEIRCREAMWTTEVEVKWNRDLLLPRD